jgi:NADH dehydrogenase
MAERLRVVIVGAGFGGLRVARGLAGKAVDMLIVDRNNYHCFLPLLYEVATAGLEPESIAQNVRRIVRGAPNVEFRMAEVTDADLDRRVVITDAGELPYDYLVLAPGSVTNYFGVSETSTFALKDLDEAVALRSQLLDAYERAEYESDVERRRSLMTVVIVGGGPTGVELAGAIAELKHHVLAKDYPRLNVDGDEARVLLLEATDRLLGMFPGSLQRRAREQLEALGVEVWLNAAVESATNAGVSLRDGRSIYAATVIWVAGIKTPPLIERLGLETKAGGRVAVEPSMRAPGLSNVFVIGDAAYLEGPDGRPYPQVAPVAIQQGALAAGNILRSIRWEALASLRYRDQGTMTTIGRRRAVAHVYGLRLSGFIAWTIWLVVHLVQLIGFRNKALVLVNWAWNYFTYDRGVRLITRSRGDRGS